MNWNKFFQVISVMFMLAFFALTIVFLVITVGNFNPQAAIGLGISFIFLTVGVAIVHGKNWW